MNSAHASAEDGPFSAKLAAASSRLVEVQLDPCLNCAMQQNGVALLKGVTVENRGLSELRDISVRLHAEPAFAEPLELRLDTLAAGSRHHWSAPQLQVSPSFLAGLREQLRGLLHIDLIVGHQTLRSEHRNVAVLAYDLP